MLIGNTLNIHTSLANIRITNRKELFSIANHLTLLVYNKNKIVLKVRRDDVISSTPMKIELNGQKLDTRPEIFKMLAVADDINKDMLYVNLANDFKFYSIKRKEYGVEFKALYYNRTITLNTEKLHRLGYQVNYSIDFGYTPKLLGTKDFYKKHKMFNLVTYKMNSNAAAPCNDYDIFQRRLEMDNSKYRLIFKVKIDDLKDLYFCTRAKHLDKPNPIQTISLKEYYGNMYCDDSYYFNEIQCENCSVLTFIPEVNNSATTPDNECYVVFFFRDSLSLIDSVSEDADISKIIQRIRNEQE